MQLSHLNIKVTSSNEAGVTLVEVGCCSKFRTRNVCKRMQIEIIGYPVNAMQEQIAYQRARNDKRAWVPFQRRHGRCRADGAEATTSFRSPALTYTYTSTYTYVCNARSSHEPIRMPSPKYEALIGLNLGRSVLILPAAGGKCQLIMVAAVTRPILCLQIWSSNWMMQSYRGHISQISLILFTYGISWVRSAIG